MLEPRTKFLGEKKKEKKEKKVAFAEARTRTLWHAKQRLYPLSHEVQHTKSETKLKYFIVLGCIRRLNTRRFGSFENSLKDGKKHRRSSN